jgi:hypothetical protein
MLSRKIPWKSILLIRRVRLRYQESIDTAVQPSGYRIEEFVTVRKENFVIIHPEVQQCPGPKRVPPSKKESETKTLKVRQRTDKLQAMRTDHDAGSNSKAVRYMKSLKVMKEIWYIHEKRNRRPLVGNDQVTVMSI